MIIDWVQDVGHIPVRQMLLQIAVRVVIIVSPSACTISAGMLSIPADFSGPHLVLLAGNSVLLDLRQADGCRARSSIQSTLLAFPFLQ